jgi:nucleoid-associated protein YgaU
MMYLENNTILKKDGKAYYKSKLYPSIPYSESDLYIITVAGDRLDLIAYTYYKDPEYWKVIAMVNDNITNGSIFPIPGTQLRIPVDINEVMRVFNELNS